MINTIVKKLSIIVIVLLIYLNGFAQTFTVYDALLYKNKPDLTYIGMKKIQMIYTGEMWLADDNKKKINKLQIQKVARKLDGKNIVCLDIEHWPTKGDSNTVKKSVLNYKAVLSLFKKEKPDILIGYYSVIPVHDYYRAIKAKGKAGYLEWKNENARLLELSHKVDIVFPDLYAFNPNKKKWKIYAIENLMEARKYGKPIYAFLCPRYHNSSFFYKGKYISADFWRFQLQTCYQYADGIVIWGGWQKDWDENAPWWNETKKFLNSLNNKRQIIRK